MRVEDGWVLRAVDSKAKRDSTASKIARRAGGPYPAICPRND